MSSEVLELLELNPTETFSQKEIAKRLNKSESNISKIISRLKRDNKNLFVSGGFFIISLLCSYELFR